MAEVLSRSQWEELKKSRMMKELMPRSEGSGWRGLHIRPKNVKFATQNKDEHVLLLLRKHWISNIGWIFRSVIYLFIPILFLLMLNLLQISLDGVFTMNFGVFVAAVYYSFWLTFVLKNFINWYYNLYLVTSQRVLDYDFDALSSMSGVSENELVSIEDVKQKDLGVMSTLLDFGDVFIYTAADKNVITFDHVPSPTKVRDLISDLARIASEDNL